MVEHDEWQLARIIRQLKFGTFNAESGGCYIEIRIVLSQLNRTVRTNHHQILSPFERRTIALTVIIIFSTRIGITFYIPSSLFLFSFRWGTGSILNAACLLMGARILFGGGGRAKFFVMLFP